MTPLSGVRISWLIFARKVDFARLADSASPLKDARVGQRFEERFLGALAFRDVAADAEDQLPAVEPGGVGADFDVEDAPVPASVLCFEVVALLVDGPQHFDKVFPRVQKLPVEDCEAPYGFERVAEHFREFFVGFVHSAVLVEDDDPVSGLLHEETPSSRLLLKLLRLFFTLRDIEKKNGEVVLPIGVGVHAKPSAEELRILLELL